MAKRGPKGMSLELKSFIHGLHDNEVSIPEITCRLRSAFGATAPSHSTVYRTIRDFERNKRPMPKGISLVSLPSPRVVE